MPNAPDSAQSIETSIRDGEIALRRRDPETARLRFEEAVAIRADPHALLLLAKAHRALGDRQSEEKAIDSALALDTRHIPALVAKGDCLAARGCERDSILFYQAALRAGSQKFGATPDEEAALSAARAAEMELRNRFEDYLYRRLADAGHGEDKRSANFERSLDILLGHRRIPIDGDRQYPQEPTSFYYAGLEQREFFERSEFDWAQALEAATEAIAAELDALLSDGSGFGPYVVQHPDQPINHHVLMDDPSWSACFLVRDGHKVAANAERCPRTLEALERTPMPRIRGREPNVLFSLLRPGAHIPPHSGIVNTQLVCHLPLIVPGDCQLRVGSDTRSWEKGKLLIFDDSIEHEAWNRSDQTRVVLLFNVWRPDIDTEERAALATLFEAVEDYGASDKGIGAGAD